MLSCWPLLSADVVFSFFEMPFDLLVEIAIVFRIACSTGFLVNAHICCYILMFEFDNSLEGLFPCLLYLLVALSERSFSSMFALLLWLVLSVLLITLAGVMLAHVMVAKLSCFL